VRGWKNQEIDWPTLPPSPHVTLCFAAQAVSHNEAGHQTMRLRHPFGHGMEPTVFWSVLEDGRGPDSPTNGLIAEIPKGGSSLTIAIQKRGFSPPRGLDPDGCLVQQADTSQMKKSAMVKTRITA
jgi:hypothetical protein